MDVIAEVEIVAEVAAEEVDVEAVAEVESSAGGTRCGELSASRRKQQR